MIGFRADMGRKWASGVGPWLTLILVHLTSALEVPLDRKWDLFIGDGLFPRVTQSVFRSGHFFSWIILEEELIVTLLEMFD